MCFRVHKQVFTSLLELTLQSHNTKETHDDASLSVAAESERKSDEHKDTDMDSEDELKTPDNIEARMRNIFEAVVELHLSICYPVSFEYIYWLANIDTKLCKYNFLHLLTILILNSTG